MCRDENSDLASNKSGFRVIADMQKILRFISHNDNSQKPKKYILILLLEIPSTMYL